MSGTQSVSQGCFSFLPKSNKTKDPLKIFEKQLWYESYKKVWSQIEKKIENLDDDVTETLLNDLLEYVSGSKECTQIPTAAILTGINLPDHGSLFSRLENKLKSDDVAGQVATLKSTDCISLRHTVERAIMQIMSSEEQYDSDEEENTISKTKCTLPNLVRFFDSQPKKKIVIMIQDFETLSTSILNDFIQILSGYIDRLPFVLIFGIATTMSAISDSLNHKTISRLCIKTFQSQPSVYFLNNTLNKVFLTPECPFQMSRKLFLFFTNVFLFYDFSVNRFIKGLKYCLMEHFREGQNVIGRLCTNDDVTNSVSKLTESDIEWIKNLNSVKGNKNFSDTNSAKMEILRLLAELKISVNDFYDGLNVLHALVSTLPQAPLGKHLRELYCAALNQDLSKKSEYKECRQLLGFLSKEKLLEKLDKLDSIITSKNELSIKVKEWKKNLITFDSRVKSPRKSPRKSLNANIKSRAEFRQMVAEMASKNKSEYETLRDEILDSLMYDIVPKMIKPFTEKPLWEIITLVESEARHRVVPRIRAPIHTALNNPSNYLLCECCKIKEPGDILATMPDICIVYKLHLECGNLINMYDWLQSFNMIVTSGSDKEIDPKVQARFTQAVSELEYMGFIKSSKAKTDHVQRLTWGGQSRR